MGIETGFIHLKSGLSRINVKIKSLKANVNNKKKKIETEINGQGPDISQEELERLLKKIANIQKGDILVLAGSIPNTLPSDIYEKIMEKLENKGIQIVVDATKDLLVNVLKYHPFLIKPNNHELGDIFGKVLKTDDEILFCAKELQKKGAKNVLVSLAKDGALLVTNEGEMYRIGVPKGDVKNSVGAGDSMVAGFIAGYLEKEDYEYALKMGTAAGSATAFSYGLAQKGDVMDLLNKIE